jgi:hypothetical protein
MKPWKFIALVGLAGLVLWFGVDMASAYYATSVPTAAFGPCYDQPNMAAALSSLKAAKASLEKAEHNKGGWRVAAIQATDKAIVETDRGCAFANK